LRVGGAYGKRCDTMRLFVFAWEQKITRRETYMHKVQPNPARHLQHAGGKVARGDLHCNRYTKID
jgi:hypothetical protein